MGGDAGELGEEFWKEAEPSLNSKRGQISGEPILVFISPLRVTYRDYLENALKDVATLLKSVDRTPGRFFRSRPRGRGR
jgi:hypothetical protein